MLNRPSNQNTSKSTYLQKVAGFMRYLNTMQQYSDHEINRLAMRMYIQGIAAQEPVLVELLSVVLTVYAKDPTHYRPKVVAFNSYINKHITMLSNISLWCTIITLVILEYFIFLYVPAEQHYQRGSTLQMSCILFGGICWCYLLDVLARKATVQMLTQLEKKLYQNAIPSKAVPLRLSIINTVKAKFTKDEETSYAHNLALLLANVPPNTINERHVSTIKKMFPHDIRSLSYQLSDTYIDLAPYSDTNFITPKEVDKLIAYLGHSVKFSEHNYID